jgi:hypothetical protein
LAAATGFDVHGLLAGRNDRIQLVYRLVCDFTVAAELWRQIWAQKPGLACLCLQCLPLCRLVLLYKPYCDLLNHGKFWSLNSLRINIGYVFMMEMLPSIAKSRVTSVWCI